MCRVLFCFDKIAKSAALICQSMPWIFCQVCFEYQHRRSCICRGGLYCSDACFKSDWSNHKLYCEVRTRRIERKTIWKDTVLKQGVIDIIESFLKCDVSDRSRDVSHISEPVPSSPPPPAADNGRPRRRWGRYRVATLPAIRWQRFNRWRRYPPEVD